MIRIAITAEAFEAIAAVPGDKRMTEKEFKKKFRQAHADTLAALCGAASIGLRVEKNLELPTLAGRSIANDIGRPR